ncbi:MAG: hypothetical protein ACP5N3_04780, partial [Candidatus Nanoarchaeia archaeon]
MNLTETNLNKIINNMTIICSEYTHHILRGYESEASVADMLFETPHQQRTVLAEIMLQTEKRRNLWNPRIDQAAKILDDWKEKSGKEQNYTPESLALAQINLEAALRNERENYIQLILADSFHQSVIAHAIKFSGIHTKLINEGEQGKKFAIVELSARLSPLLTFPGSSSYLSECSVLYGKESRIAAGEIIPGSNYVNPDVALESAKNLQRKLKVHYALAETSAAPRGDIPKSGRKPIVFITG